MLNRGCTGIDEQEAAEVDLTETERMLLMFYRRLSELDKAYLLRVAIAMADEAID